MTQKEAGKIVYTIKAAYSRHFKDFNLQDFGNLINVWASATDGYTYEQISVGLTLYIRGDTKGFPPSVGQVIDCITKLETREELNALEAWSLVRRAIKNSIYHAVEEYEKLPEACQKAVGSTENLIEWAQMDEATVNTVEQSHFIRAYNATVQRQHEEAKIPQRIRDLISSNFSRKMIGGDSFDGRSGSRSDGITAKD